MIWTYWLSIWQIETRPCGNAVCSNILELFTLILLKFIYLAKRYIAPAIHLFINWYSQATAHHSPIIYLQLKLSVQLHKEAGETLTQSVLVFLNSHIPPRIHCINRYEHLLSMATSPPCWLNQYGYIWCGTHILHLWGFDVLNGIVWLNIRLNVCLAILFAVI